MATIYISSGLIDQGETVYFVLRRASDGFVLDNDDNTWKANKAACTDEKWPATEITDQGDASSSPYVLAIDGDYLNSGSTPALIQAVAYYDKVADEVAADGELWVALGRELEDLESHISQADVYLDDTTTPWSIVWAVSGTGDAGSPTVLLRKYLYDKDNNAISDLTTYRLGQQLRDTR